MNLVSAWIAGLLFGIGLFLSGMSNPAKVLGFLDLAGKWDPSLAFVMGGAVMVGLVAFYFARRRTTTFLGGAFHLPSAKHIDRRLVLGNIAFGIGWGLGGFCPGPGLVSMAAGQTKALVFVAAMVAGMALFEFAERFLRAATRRAH